MESPNALHLLATALVGWLNRNQQAIIDYLIEENRIFKQQLDGRRLRLSCYDRRRSATRAKALGPQVLAEVADLVTLGTVLAWHGKSIAGHAGAVRPTYRRPVLPKTLAMPADNDVGGAACAAGLAYQRRTSRRGARISGHQMSRGVA